MTLDNEGAIKLIRFLYDIKKRTLLVLGQKSYTQLHYITKGFIFGYNNAVDDSLAEHLAKIKTNNIWTNFRNYFGTKHNVYLSVPTQMVNHFGSEESAFDIFFIELSNFLKENGIDEPHID